MMSWSQHEISFPQFKTIEAPSYTTRCFRAFGETFFSLREHHFAGPSHDIDCYGHYWALVLTEFSPGQVWVKRHDGLVAIEGPQAIFIPPCSIIDWHLAPGTILWCNFLSFLPVPDDLPTEPVMFALPEHQRALSLRSNDEIFELIRTSNNLVPLGKEEGQSAVASRVKNYLMEHYREECQIAEIAERLGYHRSVMTRFFKRAYGLSPIECRNKLRIIEAMLVLIRSEMSVTEAQVEMGFNDFSVFFRQFKKQILVEPSRFQCAHESPRSSRGGASGLFERSG